MVRSDDGLPSVSDDDLCNISNNDQEIDLPYDTTTSPSPAVMHLDNSSTHAEAPPDATILECTAPITPTTTTTTTTLPADPFYQGPNHYPDNAYRLLSHGVSYPVYAVGTKWEDYPSEAKQVATIESGTVCVLEAVFGDVDNEDAAAVLQIVEVLRAPEEGEEELYDAESLEDMTARLKGKIVMKRVGANGFLHANSCPLLGTWQYRCNGAYRSYKILATSRGEVQYVEETSIILKHYSPHQSVPGVASTFIAQWGGGHSIKRGNSIYFHMNTEGKLESLFVSNQNTAGYPAVATRIALASATVVPEIHGEGISSRPGVCGLRNVGNTCFMNSALQCTAACKELAGYFATGEYKRHLNRKNPVGAKGELADVYAALMKAMQSAKYSCVNPHPLKKVIDQYQPRFSGYQQHDSQEFLSYLLDGLHEDTNKVQSKPYFEESEEEAKLPEVEKEKLAWSRHRARNDSFVADLFQGQLKSILRCNICEFQGTKYESMTSISLPVQLDSVVFRMYNIVFSPADTAQPMQKFQFKHRVTEDISQAIKYFVQEKCPEITNTECLLVQDSKAATATASATEESYHVFETAFENPAFLNAESPTEQSAENADRKRRCIDATDPITQLKALTLHTPSAVPFFPLFFSVTSEGRPPQSHVMTSRTYYPHATRLLHAILIPLTATRREVHDAIARVLDTPAQCSFSYLRKTGVMEKIGPEEEGFFLDQDQRRFLQSKFDQALTEEREKLAGRVKEEVERIVRKRKSEEEKALASGALSPVSNTSTSSSSSAINVQALRPKPRLKTYLTHLWFNVVVSETVQIVEPEEPEEQTFEEAVRIPRTTTQPITPTLASRDCIIPDGEALLAEELEKWRKDASRTTRTIEECLATYTAREQLDEANLWYCPKCQELVRAYKNMLIYRPPKNLVVHFNRFSFNASGMGGHYFSGVRKKVDTPISYGELFDLQPSIDPLSPYYSPDPVTYRLYAISCHMGSAAGGHYTAYAKIGGMWTYCNDSMATPGKFGDAGGSSAYLLFYERVEEGEGEEEEGKEEKKNGGTEGVNEEPLS